MTGGGFGGAIVCLCRHDDIVKIQDAVETHYYSRFNIHASIYVGKAGDGLKVNYFGSAFGDNSTYLKAKEKRA